jgi:hypothetical protein
MRLGGKLRNPFLITSTLDRGWSPIEGPLQRSEHVIVIGYRWEFVRVSRRVQQRQITGLLSGGAGTWGVHKRGRIADHAVR